MNFHRTIDADYVVLLDVLSPEAMQAADRLRDEGWRVGLVEHPVWSECDTSLVGPLLLGARAVAVVESRGHGDGCRRRIQAALEALHPAIPRLHSVTGGDALSLGDHLGWVLENMQSSGPEVLDLAARRKRALEPLPFLRWACEALPAAS